jgi:hypothetical protein
MLAYESMGKQYFYLGNVKKAQYYIARAIRGYSEGMTSKTKELSNIQFNRRLEKRNQLQGVPTFEKGGGESFDTRPLSVRIEQMI